MLKVGIILVIIGASCYVLPLVGMHNRLIDLVPTGFQPYTGGAVIAIGAVLALLGLKKGKKKDEKK